MTTATRIRSRGCDRKMRHATLEAAEAHQARELERGHLVEVYKCRHGGRLHWHTGHTGRVGRRV